MQMTSGGRVFEQHSEEIDSEQQSANNSNNRCPSLAPSDGGIDDELGNQRPYRCHVCRVGFKLKVIMDLIHSKNFLKMSNLETLLRFYLRYKLLSLYIMLFLY